MTEEHDHGLIGACLLDGHGGAGRLDWSGVEAWQPDSGVLWLHLDRQDPGARRRLTGTGGVTPPVLDALMAEETRPRVREFDDGLLLILRGVNMNPGAEPDDMVQLRIFTDGTRIISLRRRRVFAMEDLRDQLSKGVGPRSSGDWIARTAELMGERIGEVVSNLEDNIDELEEAVLTDSAEELRSRLADMRHQAITLRRYIGPQRDALHELARLAPPWMAEHDRRLLEEIAERTMRLREDLDAARERASVIQDELANRLNERLNRNMYRLSVIAAVFLPLTLLTGVLGINVAGIPGAEFSQAFLIVCGLLVLVGLGQFWLFRRWKWF